MTYKRSFYPNEAQSPWMTLVDMLKADDMSINDLSIKSGLDNKVISDIILGKKAIDQDISQRLVHAFWMSSDFWLNLQRSYDEDIIRLNKK